MDRLLLRNRWARKRERGEAPASLVGADVIARKRIIIVSLLALVRVLISFLRLVSIALGIWIWVGEYMPLVQLLPPRSHCDRALEGCVLLEAVRLWYNESRNRVANGLLTR